MKIKKIKNKNHKVLQNFEMNFQDTDHKILDTVVIAGINGTGKTTILELIKNAFSIKLRQDDFITFQLLDNQEYTINYENTTYGISQPKTTIKQQFGAEIVYLKVSDNQKEKVIKQIKNFIDMIKDNNENLTIKEANQKAVDEINSIFDGLVLKTKFKGISKDIDRDILFENDVKDDIKLDELSTGEQQLFIRALSLKMMGLKNSIILIDEPEISLHPNWQNHILRVYQNIAKDGDNQLIIATHSPQIVSSALNESLRVLVKNGTNIEVKTFDKSYGAEIEEVLADFMDTKYLRTPEVACEIEKMWDFLNNQDLEKFELIYNKLVEILDLNDKDLVLARLEKAKQLSSK